MKDTHPHFSIARFQFSQTALRQGLSNRLPDSLLPAAHFTLTSMEVVRAVMEGKACYLTSGYRSPEVDAAVKGRKPAHMSQHSKGEAVDFVCPDYGTPFQVCLRIKLAGLHFDQMIYEGDWVHISFVKARPRRQILTARFSPDGVSYVDGIEGG